MSMFQVDSGQVAGAAAAVSASGSRLQAEVATMIAQVSSLNAQWHGAAQMSFSESLAQWQSVQHQVNEALAALSTRLMAASHTYEDAELQAQSLFTP